ncbi:mannitol dehydrogenase family protein [Dinoroseobacter sp. S76]|uniref:mannitol dehydrogenase family protein n=1 Tax=Dinoroseobacter sp. S76 TaxID=3415124 RepID=UPI003C7CB5A9
MADRLSAGTLARICDGVAHPGYTPSAHGIGIVHLGLGAFHRAHQAVYTDTALAAAGGDWRILGVSMRSTETAQDLAEQDGLYTVLERGAEGIRPRIIGSLAAARALRTDRAQILRQLSAPDTRIISLTVTEKAYGQDPQTGGLDLTHPEIAQDLKTPDTPQSVPGLLVQCLRHKQESGAGSVTLLSCDNLPENGQVLRRVVQDFAAQVAPDLSGWIEDHVRFPATMVDRITPQTTQADRDEAARLTGLADATPVQCEPFSQWVLEDDFPHGRPAWEHAGAIFAPDVTPYEHMKLRMLNGSHSLLAYAGHVAGLETISACLGSPLLKACLTRHLVAVAAGLAPLPGMDYAAYGRALISRFENPSIAHSTYQIAMDGSQKMPQRIFAPAEDARISRAPRDTYAFATAAWLRYLMGRTEDGAEYALRDPRETEIAEGLRGAREAKDVIAGLRSVPGLLPEPLFADRDWLAAVETALADILRDGALRTAERLAQA